MRKVLLIGVALLSITSLQAATRRHIVGRAGADPVFGVFVNVAARPDSEQIGRAFDLAQADGIGWVRIPFTWSTIQPNPSVTNLNLYYPIIARAKLNNLRIIGVLGYSTPWNTTAPASETRAAQRERYPPADYNAWYFYVLTMATIFKDSVHHWEVWTSPDVGGVPAAGQKCDGSWCGSGAQYAQLLTLAHKAVKAADPSATVIFGGVDLGPSADANFLINVLTDPDYPTSEAFDVMSFHMYGSKTEALRRMNFVKSQLLFGGAGTRPIWVTEFGYPSDPALQKLAPYFNGESGQTLYLDDLAAYLLLLGVRKIFWYQMFDTAGDALPTYGLLTTTFEKKQAYTTYGDFIRSYRP